MEYEQRLDVDRIKKLHARKKQCRTIETISALLEEFNEYADTLHFRQRAVAEEIFIVGEYVPYHEKIKNNISKNK